MECTALQGSGTEFEMDARGGSTVALVGLQAATHMSLAGRARGCASLQQTPNARILGCNSPCLGAWSA